MPLIELNLPAKAEQEKHKAVTHRSSYYTNIANNFTTAELLAVLEKYYKADDLLNKEYTWWSSDTSTY